MGTLKTKKIGIRPIDVQKFHSGMYIDSEIYIKIKSEFVLLCTDVTLTSSLVQKLKNAARSKYPIYVSEVYYDNIIHQSEDFAKLKEAAQCEADAPSPEDQEYFDIQNLKRCLQQVKIYRSITTKVVELLKLTEANDFIPLEMTDQVSHKISYEINHTDTAIIVQCVNNIRRVDDYLYSHSTNVATLNGLIGRWMDLPEDDIKLLVKIGLLHDIGKLRVPPDILNKPARLTLEEFEVIKQHPVDSYRILIDSGLVDERILSGVRSHHERINGMGYPDHLKGDVIPFFAKITAVSDVYDAMIAKRPYKDRNSPFEILAEFAANRFSDLDIHVIDIFLQNMPQEYLLKKALLSDGRICKIVSINPSDFAYPIVSVDNHLLKTNKYIKCVSVDDFHTIYQK